MKNNDFTTTIMIRGTAHKVFDAITNVRGWWSEQITGNTTLLGDVFEYQYEDIHRCTLKITEITTNQKIVWEVVSNYFKFTSDPTEWTGTKIIFEITEHDMLTELRFTHQGLTPAYECYNICHEAWTNYIRKSLFDLITAGKGDAITREGNDFQEAVKKKI